MLGAARLNPEAANDLRHGAEALAFPSTVPRRRVDPPGARGRTVEAVDAIQAAREGVDQDGAAVGQHARFGRELLLVAAPAGRQQDRLQQRQVGQAPYLDRRAARLEVHVARGRHDAIERRQDGEAVGPHARIDGGHGGAGGADHPPVGIELDEPAGLMMPARQFPLERRQHVAVRQARVAVGVAVRQRIAEGPRQRRPLRMAQIEDEGPAGVEAIGPQQAIGRHRVFGVMRPGPDRAGRHRGHHRRIAGAARVGVHHGEKIARGLVGVPGPQEHETAGGRRGASSAGAGVTRREGRHQAERKESQAAYSHARPECTCRRPPNRAAFARAAARRESRAANTNKP